MENKNISPIIYNAIEKMKLSFGGTDFELISKEMYRTEPSESAAFGYLGVDIMVENIKTFLGCESMAEDIVYSPIGNLIADAFVYNIINYKKND